jgi:hypothetical protein
MKKSHFDPSDTNAQHDHSNWKTDKNHNNRGPQTIFDWGYLEHHNSDHNQEDDDAQSKETSPHGIAAKSLGDNQHITNIWARRHRY